MEEEVMGHTATVRLNWRGAKTVDSLASFLERQGNVALGLAPDLHHSLFVHLHPQAPPGQPEDVDMQGGTELLARIAEIPGLEALATLVGPLQAAHARIQVQSPAPIIRISIPEAERFERHPG
jgi:hypothetical protein